MALIHGLKITSELEACGLFIRGDTELVVDQVMKEASYRDEKMLAYYKRCGSLRRNLMASSSTTYTSVTTSPQIS